MTGTQKMVVAAATLVAAFGLMMLAGVSIGFLEGTSNYRPGTDALMALLFGVVPIVGGALAARRVFGERALERRHQDEAAVLEVAVDLATPITAVDVAARAGLPLSRAQSALDRLHLAGHCEMDVSPTAVIVYRFGPSPTPFEPAQESARGTGGKGAPESARAERRRAPTRT